MNFVPHLAAVWYREPLVYAIALGGLALWCLAPRSTPWRRAAGSALAVLSAAAFVAAALGASGAIPPAEYVEYSVLGFLAVVTVGSGVAMVSSRSAVYSAIWFALALLGTGGLFLYQGAQFLGVATVVVYAGAIVVTFLFVIMLAQPDGHASYDRISWGWFAKPAAAIAGALLLGAIAWSLQGLAHGGVRQRVLATIDKLHAAGEISTLQSQHVALVSTIKSPLGPRQRAIKLTLHAAANEVTLSDGELALLAQALVEPAAENAGEGSAPPLKYSVIIDRVLSPPQDLAARGHMAHLGGYLFSRHLIAVEVGGTLLLAALVGAIAMLSQRGAPREEGGAHV